MDIHDPGYAEHSIFGATLGPDSVRPKNVVRLWEQEYSYLMAEWLVELEGHPAELGGLADQFLSSRLKVHKEGERYYLRSPEEFEGLSDASDVLARATELLFLLSGIANLYAGAGETVTPGAVIWERDDGTHDQVIDLKPASLRVRATLRLGTKATDPTGGESWLTLARQDDKVL